MEPTVSVNADIRPIGYFEDVEIGRRVEFGHATLSTEAIVTFANAYDPLTFHVDEHLARSSHFGGLIASGIQTFAVAHLLAVRSGFVDERMVIGGAGVDDMRFLRPVRPGERFSVGAEILEKIPPKPKRHHGIVLVAYAVSNTDCQTALRFVDRHVIRLLPGIA